MENLRDGRVQRGKSQSLHSPLCRALVGVPDTVSAANKGKIATKKIAIVPVLVSAMCLAAVTSRRPQVSSIRIAEGTRSSWKVVTGRSRYARVERAGSDLRADVMLCERVARSPKSYSRVGSNLTRLLWGCFSCSPSARYSR